MGLDQETYKLSRNMLPEFDFDSNNCEHSVVFHIYKFRIPHHNVAGNKSHIHGKTEMFQERQDHSHGRLTMASREF